MLAGRHVDGLPDGRALDVVSLSLGYYPETDDLVPAGYQAVLGELSRLGVAVVVSAGNDATTRPMLPAALAAQRPQPGAVPLSSVGALNPDGTVAVFSNSGPWVTSWAPGAALVSTFPVVFDGGRQPSSATTDPAAGRPRGTIDPDSFGTAPGLRSAVSGFGTWSGTSFAAPVFAAAVARAR